MGDEISLNQVTAQYGDSQKVRDYFNIADHDKSGTLSAAEQEVLTAALAGQPGGSGKFISVGGVTFFASDVTYIKTNENASQKGAFDYTVAFDKYVTGAKSFKLTGIGLGLYFSKKVVDAHDGRIYLEANGEHNKFVFEIPVTDSKINTSVAW